MSWRQWIGLPPTEADFARHLLSLAKQAGELHWQYDPAHSLLRLGDHVVNLGNLYLEYSRADRRACAGSMVFPSQRNIGRWRVTSHDDQWVICGRCHRFNECRPLYVVAGYCK